MGINFLHFTLIHYLQTILHTGSQEPSFPIVFTEVAHKRHAHTAIYLLTMDPENRFLLALEKKQTTQSWTVATMKLDIILQGYSVD